MKHLYLTTNNARMGHRVILANPNPRYSVGSANPVINTHFFCYGTIIRVTKSGISVEWNNGSRNTYTDNELALSRKEFTTAETENKKYISIW